MLSPSQYTCLSGICGKAFQVNVVGSRYSLSTSGSCPVFPCNGEKDRAALKGVKICDFLRKSAFLKSFVFQETARISKNHRKSAEICVGARFVPVSLSPSALPEKMCSADEVSALSGLGWLGCTHLRDSSLRGGALGTSWKHPFGAFLNST